MAEGRKRQNTGKPYEAAVESYFRKKFPGCEITLDCKVQGLYGTEQIDLLVVVPIPHGPPIKIGVEAKDHGRRLSKDTFGSICTKFESARVNRGIIMCSHGVQKGVQERIDKVPFDFQLEVLTYEQLVQWADRFLDAIPLLKEAKASVSPSDQLIGDVIRAIEAHEHYSRYFFHEQTNLAWLPILAARGVFERSAKGESQVSPALTGEYVSAGVKDYPAQFLAYCRKLTQTNLWAFRSLIQASGLLSETDQKEFFGIVSSWPFWGSLVTAEAVQLIDREVRAGRTERALRFLDRLTALEVVRTRVTDYYERAELTSGSEHYDFHELIVERLPALAQIDPAPILDFIHTRVENAVRDLYPDSRTVPLYICEHVGDPDFLHAERYLGSLISGYVSCLRSASDTATDVVLDHSRNVISKGVDVISIRCILLASSEWSSIRVPLLPLVVPNDMIWANPAFEPEFEEFVESSWREMTDTQRCDVLQRILRVGREATEEKPWLKGEAVEWLVMLMPLGIPRRMLTEVQSAFEAWSAETGVSERRERASNRGLMSWVDRTPDEAKDFPAMTVDQVLSFCIQFVGSGEFPDETSPDGIGPKLKEDVAKRPIEYLRKAELVKQLPYPVYLIAVIQGMTEAGFVEPAPGVIDVCRLSSGLVAKPTKDDGRSVAGAGMRDGIVPAAARYVEAVSQHCERIVDTREMAAMADLLKTLWEDQDFGRSFLVGSNPDEVFSNTLNSTDGPVALALGALTTRCLRQTRMNDEGFPPSLGQITYQQLRQQFAKAIWGSQTPRVRAAGAVYFSEFWRWDRDWASENVDGFFATGDEACWLAAWSTYMTHHRYADSVSVIRAHYEKAIFEVEAREHVPRWGSAVAHDIAFFWLTGEVKEKDSLVVKLLNSRREMLSAAVWQIGHYLKEYTGDNVYRLWKRAIKLWTKIAGAPNFGDDGITVGIWLDFAPIQVTATELAPLLIKVVGRKKSREKHLIWKFLEQRAEAEPECVSRCLVALTELDGEFMLGGDIESVKRSFQAIYETGNEPARQNVLKSVENLLKQGYFGFEGLITP
jgi:hypothetical protein